MNNKGGFESILLFVVSIAAFAIFLLIVGYIGNAVGTQVKAQINSTNPVVNNAFDKTIVTSTKTLSMLWYIMFSGMLFFVLVSAWYMKEYPIMIPVYLILLICSIIVGAAMSDAYEELSKATALTTAATQQHAVVFMMSNLPCIALIVGLLALVVGFAKPESIGGGTTLG